MENNELYPELAEYIFQYCGSYFTEKEKAAQMHMIAMSKSKNDVNSKVYKFFVKEGNRLEDKEIMELVKDGFKGFSKKVSERIFREHKNELSLNLCPKCGIIARTPHAQQCRFCYHDWHDKKNE